MERASVCHFAFQGCRELIILIDPWSWAKSRTWLAIRRKSSALTRWSSKHIWHCKPIHRAHSNPVKAISITRNHTWMKAQSLWSCHSRLPLDIVPRHIIPLPLPLPWLALQVWLELSWSSQTLIWTYFSKTWKKKITKLCLFLYWVMMETKIYLLGCSRLKISGMSCYSLVFVTVWVYDDYQRFDLAVLQNFHLSCCVDFTCSHIWLCLVNIFCVDFG